MAFKQVVCVLKRQSCDECLLKGKCVYSYIFETPHTEALKAKYHSSDYPHPFVIEPPLEQKQEYEPGKTLDFNLLLIGKGIDYLPYFIFAFEELGRRGIGRGRGKYHLEKVEALTHPGRQQGKVIYDGVSKTLSAGYKVKDFDEIREEVLNQDHPTRRLTLHFLTPTRIKHWGKLTKDVDFEILLRGLLRRILLLSELHCDGELQIDCQTLIERAKTEVKTTEKSLVWYDWERYSRRQDTRLKMGGFVGRITFEGDLDDFLPYVLAGEYLHIGKGTVYGLGKYRIVMEE